MTTLGTTTQQPLGALPAPLRSAVLRTAHKLAPDLISVQTQQTPLLYAEGAFERVTDWKLLIDRPNQLRDRTARKDAGDYTSLSDFIERHDLGKPEYGQDEHYAERLFLEEAFMPSLGLDGLSLLTPQEPFKDSENKRRRVDFVLRGSRRYALEVEGQRYHGQNFISSETFDDEKGRQRNLSAAGFTYLPFSVADIRSGRAEAVLNNLALHDDVLSKVCHNRYAHSPQAGSINLRRIDALLDTFPSAFQESQLALLELFHLWEEENRTDVTLVDHGAQLSTLPLALLDLISAAERVAAMYDLPLRLPRLTIAIRKPTDPTLYRTLLTEYLGDALDPHAIEPDPLRSRLDLSWLESETMPEDAIIVLPRQATVEGDVMLPRQMTALANMSRARYGANPPLDAQPIHVDRDLLDYFTRRFFNVPELKPEQVKLIQRALRQESGLGLLPTGFGKSLVFQLFAMLIPRTSLVISPLKALIRDQVHSLHRQGLVSVEAITSTDSTAAKSQKLEGFRTHAFRLLYVSPERLQIKGFAEELRASMNRTPVGALIIDEAHCVSEWGHDFRPAYLQIRRLREMLQEASGRPVPIIGLTATASEPVRKDVLRVLGLSEQNVEQLASSDRTNISLSVHPLGATHSNKADLLAHVIEKVIPAALHIPFREFMPLQPRNTYPHAGVIFAVYANTHGKTTLEEGVHAISKQLQRRIVHDPDLISVHASTAPTSCPDCGSAVYVSASAKELEAAGVMARYGGRCLDCGAMFSDRDIVTDKDWETKLLARQDAFQDSQFPLLVATKGYGMGIDKRNIRFVVHHALSSGLEGFYQEAGRAGRDGEHSHAALIYQPPAEECYQRHLKAAEEPPCVSDAGNLKFHKCPFGLKPLCDYGRQAHFVKSSYPGVEQDVAAATGLLPKLAEGPVFQLWKDEEVKTAQMALFRLQQLCVVGSYTLEYKARRTVSFEVERLPWTKSIVLHRLTEHLQRDLDLPYQAVQYLCQRAGLDTSPDHQTGGSQSTAESTLHRALIVLVNVVYDRIQRMRYQMLTNELEYARPPEAKKRVCRRVIIRSIFDSVDHLPDDYNCGFCDVCVPDLNFQRKNAVVAPKDANLDEITRLLPEVMEHFDPLALVSLVDLADRHGAVIGLSARASHQLEHDPSNLSALFLAGALRAKRHGSEDAAFNQLAMGYTEAVRTGAGEDAQRLFYDTAKRVQPEEAFGWITERGGKYDTPAGLRWIETEALTLFGEQSQQHTLIKTVRRLRQVQTVHEALQETIAPLQQLAESFGVTA
ncbi:DEAD/DEAH box helicase [Deinococcus koreensis]|nr:DEAD/DEAH box helicase [Deinococcus koreensis]